MAEIFEIIRLGTLNSYDYMLRALMEKVDTMQEHTGDVSRDVYTLRKNPKEMV